MDKEEGNGAGTEEPPASRITATRPLNWTRRIDHQKGRLVTSSPVQGGNGWGIKGMEPLSTSSVSPRQLFYTVLLSEQRGGTLGGKEGSSRV